MSEDNIGKTFTAKLSPDGRVVIPSDNRKCLNLESGNMIELTITGVKDKDSEVKTTIEDEIKDIYLRIKNINDTINPIGRNLLEDEYEIVIKLSKDITNKDFIFLLNECDSFQTVEPIKGFIFSVWPNNLKKDDDLVKFIKENYNAELSDILKGLMSNPKLILRKKEKTT